ncbi:DNA-binding GntR family transcriptional regulator [Pseudarthrobacter sp. PvP004]|uniref:GntR family transcriptional regulator n=1 Tax=Pseudarthrobacter sp. PvP004 TaxID=2817850 RepID=UPI0027DB0195|nr:GntR family transcriptional regulator [Pseudarthrobacter sp. PvP004]MBP2267804.1 DNA-binding GntR family transcriptional regulator [Pseudarthrobacter sp. PvP004]
MEGRPTAQLIADHLRNQIVQGVFLPGEQIKESVLAAQLHTSRGPVREAVQRLSQEGILVSRRNRGVFVLELSPQDNKEIYAVREAMEITAADALLDADPGHLRDTCRALSRILRSMAKQVTVSHWHNLAQLDMEFHTTFVAGARNSRMSRIYETLAAESTMCILALENSYPRPTDLVHEHQTILNFLEAGNKQDLHHAIRRHLEKAVLDLAV